MLYLTEEDVHRLLPMKDCVDLMRRTFEALGQGQAVNQIRRRIVLPTGTVLHQMAGAWESYLGTKIYAAHAKHGAYFTFLLYDAASARPLANFEANFLGQIRTGAASGYATSVMAAPGAQTLGLIGSGFQAWSQLEAMLAVRPIRTARVYSRKRERRAEFAERASRFFEIEVLPVDTAEEACREADIVITATFAKDPVVESGWIKPGAHVNAMGSNQASRRELPADLLHRARRIAIDSLEQARVEAGDLLLALPIDQWHQLPLVELGDMAAGKPVPEHAGGDITIFKSLGLGVEDVAAGAYVYERWMRERYQP